MGPFVFVLWNLGFLDEKKKTNKSKQKVFENLLIYDGAPVLQVAGVQVQVLVQPGMLHALLPVGGGGVLGRLCT
jgi:hypothetical protein